MTSRSCGNYSHLSDTLDGETGRLTLDFWPLDYHVTPRGAVQQVIPMLKCFEHWFGRYPWYVDGYSSSRRPHLAWSIRAPSPRHHFLNGYLGRDLSGTGLGLQWDFISCTKGPRVVG